MTEKKLLKRRTRRLPMGAVGVLPCRDRRVDGWLGEDTHADPSPATDADPTYATTTVGDVTNV